MNDKRSLLALHDEVQRFRESDPTVCAVAPHPDLKEQIKGAIEAAREGADELLMPRLRVRVEPNRPGFNDGLIVPPEDFPVGTPLPILASAAADRAPLRGTVRVIVVLVEFSDRQIGATADRFRDLFFSTGTIATGSVREYYNEVSNGLVTIDGEVVGPYTLPLTLAQYCNGASGIGSALPNASTMARDAVLASDVDVNFAPYDNDGNGFVDAFVIVHAGSGAEQTGSNGDIWSHKWNVQGGAMTVDATKIFGYLTIPEDALLGVSAHEVGHLLWGWPDLYDTDGSSEGIGNWCLMAGGSWNGNGDTPAHPCGFLKLDQGWATVTNQTTNGAVTLQDVKDSHNVLRLWKDGTPGSEYFLVENRQKDRFDAQLPGGGVLIWHIDEAVTHNRDEAHYRVALMQADGKRDMENDANRGDAGDCYPGSTGNTAFTGTSTPNSKSYAGVDTCVSLTGISPSGPVMTANAGVVCLVKLKERPKELKDLKDRLKDRIKDKKERPKELKERPKELKDLKDRRKERPKDLKEKDFKEAAKELKERAKEIKEAVKEMKEGGKELFDRPGGDPFDFGGASETETTGDPGLDSLLALEARVAALEAEAAQGSEPFIGEELRPDLTGGAFAEEGDAQAREITQGGRDEKRELDQWQPEV